MLSSPPISTVTSASAETLLDWYDHQGRSLPWRRLSATGRPDVYHVWLSEMMLQQTTVVTVIPYFEKFLSLWPDLTALAHANLDDVLSAWAGLGYYARARNLHKCAQTLLQEYQGNFPQTAAELQKLPGIGPYSSAAIAAIAFGEAATIVDGNVERVISRLCHITTPLPDSKPEIKLLAAQLTPLDRSGDYAQAIMDLGATVCTPRKPDCILCPWRDACQGRIATDPETLPAKRPKKAKPTRTAIAFWTVRPDGFVLIRRRPPKGLLGGMLEIPSTDWIADHIWELPEAVKSAPIGGLDWSLLPGQIRHTFTHFHLDVQIALGQARQFTPTNLGEWVSPEQLQELGLPTLMRKIYRHALKKR